MAYYVIRNPRSGLVLEVNEYNKVTLQRNTGFPKQLWAFQNTKDGKTIIVNKGNGKVLDMEGGATSGAQIITTPNEERTIQKWVVNNDKTIASAADPNLVLDICAEKFSAGTSILAYKRHGGENQKFERMS